MGTSHSTPNSISDSTPHSTSHSTPHSTSHSTPHSASHSTSHSSSPPVTHHSPPTHQWTASTNTQNVYSRSNPFPTLFDPFKNFFNIEPLPAFQQPPSPRSSTN